MKKACGFRIFLTAMTTLLIGFDSVAQRPARFLSDGPASFTPRGASLQPEVVRSRVANVNVSVLPDAPNAVGSMIRLNLFPDADFDVVLESAIQRRNNEAVYRGFIEGNPSSSVTLVQVDDVIITNVRSYEDGNYEIRTSFDGIPEVREVDPSQYGQCGLDDYPEILEATPSGPIAAFHRSPRAVTDDVIDVMIAYTSAARTSAGGTSEIEAMCLLAIADSNDALANSEIDGQFRLVHTEETSYTESGNYLTDLGRLQATADGFMDSLHTSRSTYGADIVALLIDDTPFGTGGLGYVMSATESGMEDYAFSVNEYFAAAGGLVLAHEMGHNMGCGHANTEESESRLFTYSQGWRWTGNDGKDYRSVMAYQPGIGVPHFSNPNVTYQGVATGVSNSADNALSINNAMSEVVGWTSPAAELSVLPLDGFLSYGPQGGSFSPTSNIYTLKNTGGSSLDWTASADQSWVDLSSSGGTLAAGAFTTVTVTVNSSADSLTATTNMATVTFSDTTNGNDTYRTVTLLFPFIEYSLSGSDPGFIKGTGWEYGTPIGDGGGFNLGPDPDSGFTGSNVYGVNISGDYSSNIATPSFLIMGPEDCSDVENATLRFARWLNHLGPDNDASATVEVSNDNANWTSVYDLTRLVEESEWREIAYDISSVADGESTVYIRWGYTTNEDGGDYLPAAGWNIDDIRITGDTTAPIADPDNLYVDFGAGSNGNGAETFPFDNLSDAVSGLNTSGTIRIESGSSTETFTGGSAISKAMTIQSNGGTVTIGEVVP